MNKKDKGDKRSLRENMAYLISNAWSINKKAFIYFGIFTILTAIRPFIGIFMPKYLIKELTGAQRQEIILTIIAIFFILSSLVGFFTALLDGIRLPEFIKIRFRFMEDLHSKSMCMDFKHTENPKTLNDMESAWRAVNNNVDGIEGVYHKIFEITGSVIAFLGYITIVMTLSPWILLYLVANVTVVYFLTLKVKKYAHSKKDNISESQRKSNYIYQTMYDFSYGKDIRIYNMKDWLADKFKLFTKEREDINKDIKYKYFVVSLCEVVLLLAREGLVYAYLIHMVINKGLTIDNFTMYFITIAGFAALMQKIIKDLAHIRAQNLYINDFRDYLEIEDEKKLENPSKIPEDKTYEIEFRNVSFKYPNSDRYIYKNLSFKIEKGQRLAIVGINGAGKTTLVKLITRLYEPNEGEILLNGVNIAEFDREEYFKIFSVVFQDIKMFAFSVANNISVDTKSSDRDKIMKCIEMAGMKEKIQSLEQGMDTSVLKVLDDKGIEFSGGENQKLALARALYKDGKVVILDEPTAALDPIAEYNIYKGFNELVGEKSSIYISHRLSSTRFCDVIAFFENGEILEYGTHDELMNKGGRYFEMFNIQAQYYQNEAVEEVV
ncbi:ABC transporter ATP-binding protein [Oceanirhabdus sp. W0125-5]|uniref:ABC transporter ATP-binding protein n=1 Tax=Oceanirhabdus sp. W0125-5 TaxID=2999116 RepID=UPI0022F2FE13|nr:ABC transporter ATP-binding protein [Oceanirhabdus sp. W0125-5]WBW97821.1 ABC transporter ATP-binding protein [Oceanirhabdus sp. W0125-5]